MAVVKATNSIPTESRQHLADDIEHRFRFRMQGLGDWYGKSFDVLEFERQRRYDDIIKWRAEALSKLAGNNDRSD